MPAFLLLLACTGRAPLPVESSTPAPPPASAGAPPASTEAPPAACPALPFAPLAPHDPDGPLCEVEGLDPAFPACEIAYGGASDRDPAEVPDRLTVATWNVEF